MWLPVVFAGLAALLLAIACVTRFGSLAAARAYLRGHVVIAESPVKDVGELSAGDRKPVAFLLKNLTSQPVTVTGAQTSCGCLVTNDLPLTFAPLQEHELTLYITAKTPNSTGPFSHTVQLFLDVPSPTLVLRVEGLVKAEDSAPEKETRAMK